MFDPLLFQLALGLLICVVSAVFVVVLLVFFWMIGKVLDKVVEND